MYVVSAQSINQFKLRLGDGCGQGMVLGIFQCRGILLACTIVRQGPTALAVTAGRDCLDIFSLAIIFLFFLLLSGTWIGTD